MNGLIVNHDDVKQLPGAYALDAVDPDEASAVREHLAFCPRCSTEVTEHQQVAGLLANSGGDAPAHLWELIAEKIERSSSAHDSDLLEVTEIFPSPQSDKSGAHGALNLSGHRRGRALFLGAAAAAVVVIASLGVQVSRLDSRVGNLQAANETQGVAQAAESALSDPSARRIALTAAHSTGPAIAQILILPSGSAFLVDSQLPQLPKNHTYQLWGRQGDQLISLGLLGSHPHDVAFWVDPAAAVTAFAITDEHAGGVVRSTQVPVAVSPTLSA